MDANNEAAFAGNDGPGALDAAPRESGDSALDSTVPCDPLGGDAANGGAGPWYALPGATFPAFTNITGVASDTGEIWLFGVDVNGAAVATHTNAPNGPSSWWSWEPVTAAPTPLVAGTSITPIARTGGRVDLFAIRGDGTLIRVTNGASTGWSSVGTNPPVFPAQQPAAIARDANHVEVFAIANNVVVQSSEDNAHTFGAWVPVANSDDGGAPSFPSDSTLTGISRTPSTLDVFALASDHRFYTASRDLEADASGWQSWIAIGTRTFPAASVGAPVSRILSQWDLYTLNSNEDVYFTLRNFEVPPPWYCPTGWLIWDNPVPVAALTGSRIAAIAESPSPVRLYVVDRLGTPKTLVWTTTGWAAAWVPVSGCRGAVNATSIAAVLGMGGIVEAVVVDTSGVVHVADRAAD